MIRNDGSLVTVVCQSISIAKLWQSISMKRIVNYNIVERNLFHSKCINNASAGMRSIQNGGVLQKGLCVKRVKNDYKTRTHVLQIYRHRWRSGKRTNRTDPCILERSSGTINTFSWLMIQPRTRDASNYARACLGSGSGDSNRLSRSSLSACRCRFLERWTRGESVKQGREHLGEQITGNRAASNRVSATGRQSYSLVFRDGNRKFGCLTDETVFEHESESLEIKNFP